MGNVFANLFKGLFGKKEMRILVSNTTFWIIIIHF